MLRFKMVNLNKGLKASREKDLEQAEEIINQYVSDGWTLKQIVTPDYGMGTMVGVFYREQGL